MRLLLAVLLAVVPRVALANESTCAPCDEPVPMTPEPHWRSPPLVAGGVVVALLGVAGTTGGIFTATFGTYRPSCGGSGSCGGPPSWMTPLGVGLTVGSAGGIGAAVWMMVYGAKHTSGDAPPDSEARVQPFVRVGLGHAAGGFRF